VAGGRGSELTEQEREIRCHANQGFDVFVATGLTPGTPELELEEQDLRSQWFPRAGVDEMIRGGVITDDASLAAYTLFLLDPGVAR
jgi:8-oxo-dGDP phosphatase